LAAEIQAGYLTEEEAAAHMKAAIAAKAHALAEKEVLAAMLPIVAVAIALGFAIYALYEDYNK